MDKRIIYSGGEVGLTSDEINLMPESNREGITSINDGLTEGKDVIISGVNAVINNGVDCVIESGFIFLDGEVLKVDAQTVLNTEGSDLYQFVKETTNNITEWDRDYRDGSTHNVYEKNRAVVQSVSVITGFSVDGDTILDDLKNSIREKSDWNETDTQSTKFIDNKPNVPSVLLQGSVNGIDVSGTGSITVQGGVTSVDLLDTGNNDYRIRINFASVGTSVYHPIITPVSKSIGFDTDNDVFFMVRNLTSTSFELVGKEQVNNTQDIDMLISIISLDLS